jgi:hypothetical protein
VSMETMRSGMASVGRTAPKTAGFRRSKAERAGVAPFPHRARSPRRRWGGLAITGALAALGLACGGSPTEPGALDTLVAVSVEGESLPATVVDWPDFHLELLADTVRFSGETYAHRRTTRFTGIIGVPEIHDTGTDGSVRVEGRSITLEPSCDALFCVDIVLVRVGNRYWATWAPTEGVEVLVEYRRLAEGE